jgi:hypothetical protein
MLTLFEHLRIHLNDKAIHALSLVTVVSFNACSTPGTWPRLSEAEVVRLADGEAQKDAGVRLQEFDRATPTYLRRDDVWRVDYHRRKNAGTGPGGFTVRVDGKTKETAIVAADPASAFSQ